MTTQQTNGKKVTFPTEIENGRTILWARNEEKNQMSFSMRLGCFIAFLGTIDLATGNATINAAHADRAKGFFAQVTIAK